MDAFRIETLTTTHGIFDDIADATYILTMENATDRHKSIYEQLKWFHPTKKVNIWFNGGYKKHVKIGATGERIDNTFKDLTHANIMIFKDALKNNYNRIIVLEDDFIMSKKILDADIQNDITSFVSNNEIDCYSFGCIPFVNNISTIFNNHVKLHVFGATHSMLYSKDGMEKILDAYKSNSFFKEDIDYITSVVLDIKYTYHIPLSFQLFAETENYKTWGTGCGYIMDNIISPSNYYLLKLLKMDEADDQENKWINVYMYIKIIHLLIYIILIVLIYLGIKKIYPSISNKSIFKRISNEQI